MPTILPIRDLRDTTRVSELAHESGEPVFITKNGYGDMVVLSMEAYDSMVARIAVHDQIAAGAASKLYRDVLRALGDACGMPYSSPDCSRYLVADPAYRCRLVGNYLLVYRVDDAGRRIEVLRFLYARRDIGADAIGRASAGD